jgi:hypothetical protein
MAVTPAFTFDQRRLGYLMGLGGRRTLEAFLAVAPLDVDAAHVVQELHPETRGHGG